MGKKITITGGAGFIGSNLAELLAKQGNKVTVIDDLSTGLTSNLDLALVELKEVCLTDAENLKNALKGSEVIFHLGARGSVPRSIQNPVTTHLVNTTGTINVLEHAREFGTQVIFSSSSSVYGRNVTIPKEEKMWLGPITPYAASKLSAEAFVEAYGATYGFSTTIFRFFNVFGPKQRPDHQYAAVIPKWIWNAMNDKSIELHGDGNQSRDFTYVKTVVEVLSKLTERNLNYAGAINLAYGNNINLNYIIDLLRMNFPKVKVKNIQTRKGDVRHSENSPLLINSLIPEINPENFERAFSETVEWIKKNRNSIEKNQIPVD
jgi:UDP-glucose 4-epimerase